MIATLKSITPTARKQHTCEFCSGTIEIGEKYSKQTNVYDGVIYDWNSHIECTEVASMLNMYDDVGDEGLSECYFREYLDEYVYANHYDKEIDDVSTEWQLPYRELVKKIHSELKEEVK